jgi:Lanthionine synthetase C-like protein/Protein kinase domain
LLSRSLPILVNRGVPFKHVSSLQELAFLSSGRGGLTQIGKFLAVYPPDPAAAAELAQVLHDATGDLTGPRIRSEAVFAENSLVHYRYGGFARKSLQLLTGRIVPARVGPDGILEPDDRSEGKSLPATQAPLFQDKAPLDAHLLCGRYIRIQPLHQGPKGTTWLGFDTAGHDDDLLVIKEAYAHVMEASDGLDARERLRHEASGLAGLRSTHLVPAFHAFWEEERSAFLVYEFIDGRPFDSLLNALAAEGLRPTATLLRDWAGALCDLVSGVHRQGYVIGDFKPANLILTEKGFRLIDLELGGRADQLARGGMGTRGYVSPQQSDRMLARSFQDDIFALGATILAAATTMDCSVLPDSLVVARLESHRDPLNPFYPVIETCLAPEPAERFASVEAVAACLSAPPEPALLPVDLAPVQECDFLRLAVDVGNLLLGTAVSEDANAWWVSPHTIVGNVPVRDLYAGSSGTALFLCALHEATRDARYIDLALRAATWLDTTEPVVPAEGDMPGLYFGICGPGLLFLRLHALTGEARWLDRAIAVGEKAARMPAHSPDIMTGRAGTGLFHLALWKACGQRPSLDRAFSEARVLLQTRSAERSTWVIPPGHESLSGNAYLGFAHGSAGIGYFLAECGLAREDGEISQACSTLADWFVEIGRPCLGDGSGLTWGLMADDAPGPVNWCHGAPGIASS